MLWVYAKLREASLLNFGGNLPCLELRTLHLFLDSVLLVNGLGQI